MFDLHKPFNGLVAHAPRGAVRRNQLGMLGLQLFQPLDQPIVLEIGYLRGGSHVIQIIVTPDFLAKPGDFGGRIGRHDESLRFTVYSTQFMVHSLQFTVF